MKYTLLFIVLISIWTLLSADDSDYIERLLKLQKLKDMGVLTETEYSERKNLLIDQYIGVKKTVESEHPERWVKVIDFNKGNLNQNGTGNETWRMPIVFTAQVKWLVSIFANSMPKSYDDKLPTTGKMFWYTEKYLSERPKDPNKNGTIVAFDDQVAIQERALTHIGLNLYDGGVWAVALSLSGLADFVDVYYKNVLYVSTTGSNEFADGLANIRASSHARDYHYGPSEVTDKNLDKVKIPGNMTYVHKKDPKCCGTCCETTYSQEIPGGFFYRMIGPSYRMWDPFQGLYGFQWRAIPAGPNNDSTQDWNLAGLIHWNDWKPITGENVWAVILAPIQTMFIRNCTHVRKFKTFEEAPDEIQFACTIVPALMALKSPLGSMYHCPLGTDMFPVDPDEKTNVSNENNFSAYAAFKAFAFILDNFYAGGDATLDKMKENMKDLIDGLEKWFASHLMPTFMKGENAISQGGHVSFAGEYIYQDGEQGFAVDCQTWGLLNVGQKKFDAKYGFGMAYKVWQTTKKLSGYYVNGTKDKLAGVGYTVHNQKNQTKIWSGEWTWGAVFMCKRIGVEYQKAGQATWGQEMLADAKSMVEEMSKKSVVDEDGVWKSGGLVQIDGSHLYANNRFFIPWGWYANPLGATSSTSWAVFHDYEYNPFQLGGGFNTTFFDKQCKDNAPEKDILSKLAKFYDYEEKKPTWF